MRERHESDADLHKDASALDGATGGATRFIRPYFLLSLAFLCSIVFFITTYALVHFVDGVPTHVSVLFAFAVVAALSLSVLVGSSLLDVFRNSKADVRGARLHRRLVSLLSLVAVIPAALAFALTGTVLQAFSDEYFVDRVSEANLVARDFANAYVSVESQNMGLELVRLAGDLAFQERIGVSPESAPVGFRRYLLGQMLVRGFSSLVIIDSDGRIVSRVSSGDQAYRLPPAQDFREVSVEGSSPFKFSAHDQGELDAWYAILKLNAPGGGYLIAYREENDLLSQQLLGVRRFRDQTADVRERLSDLSRTFAIGYGVVVLLFLLGAVWIGLLIANAIVNPVRRLATAAEAVSGGDLSSRVDVRNGDAELGDLGRVFNEMTRQLEGQRDDLIAAHEQSDARRRFIETVLSGVPAGVLNVRLDGRIALTNPSADQILDCGRARAVGANLTDVAPELGTLLGRAREEGGDIRDQIELSRGGMARIINVRISPDDPNRQQGFVITLDDITELVSAQRNAAWGDVARRIAHEIKNPLTPIQLSAERLKRKYGRNLGEDREVFDRCTDTIIRHVGDIGRMVNEFSSFARMPEPIMTRVDLTEIVRSSAFSFTVAHPSIRFENIAPDGPLEVHCDGRLIGQAVVNLVKNAVEAISENQDLETSGHIALTVRRGTNSAIVEIADNGRGLPIEGRSRLTEPYITTRSKGTGLGLAIVRKAVDEHGGQFDLLDQGVGGGQGTTARITLPLAHADQLPPANDTAPEAFEKEA